MTIWHASMETSHFTFHAFGQTEEEARGAMDVVWGQHARMYHVDVRPDGASINDYWGVRVEPTEFGGGYSI